MTSRALLSAWAWPPPRPRESCGPYPGGFRARRPPAAPAGHPPGSSPPMRSELGDPLLFQLRQIGLMFVDAWPGAGSSLRSRASTCSSLLSSVSWRRCDPLLRPLDFPAAAESRFLASSMTLTLCSCAANSMPLAWLSAWATMRSASACAFCTCVSASRLCFLRRGSARSENQSPARSHRQQQERQGQNDQVTCHDAGSSLSNKHDLSWDKADTNQPWDKC